MNKFGFLVHPLNIEDITNTFKFMRKFPPVLVEKGFRYMPAFKASVVTGIKSLGTDAEVEGVFVACPLTSRQMREFPESYVIKRIIKAGRIAEKSGAQILGLGAMTSVIGDAGITVAQNLGIPVTTGNSYTVATALQGAKKAAAQMDIDISEAEVAVVGATGSIGAVCAQIIARQCKYLTLIAPDKNKLDKLAQKIIKDTGQAVKITSNIEALRRAQIVLTVTSAAGTIIDPEYLAPGSVVCDVARPRDVSRRVSQTRKDVLVIEGGLVKVPGKVSHGLHLGYPQNITLACMAETMLLALEGQFESFTLGRGITVEQVERINMLAQKHGFTLAGFRSFEKSVTDDQIELIKRNAQKAKNQMAV